MNKAVIVLWLFTITFATVIICDDVNSPLTDFEHLPDMEQRLIQIFEDYIQVEQERIDKLKAYTTEYQEQHRLFMQDLNWNRLNPLNILKLVKRMTANRKKIENIISTHNENSAAYFANITKSEGYKTKFPTYQDYTGVVPIFTKLQGMYLLETASLAKGQLEGAKDSPELDAQECFDMGLGWFHKDNFKMALQWMKEAHVKMKKENGETENRSKLLEHLAFVSYQEGDLQQALHYTNELLEIEPTHSAALINKETFEYKLEYGDPDKRFYEPLCRGDPLLDPNVAAKLKCRYVNRNDPYLSIGPFKVEEVHRKPDIWIYHDVLADGEIEIIKKTARPKMMEAEVETLEGPKVLSEARITKNCWLHDDEHEVFVGVNQRIKDMTGLDLKLAEALQVGNYGIGGHYTTHGDYLGPEQKTVLRTGNRIATVLFYMNDVPRGGATVFPRLNVTLWPTKGAAALWYNLSPNGEPNRLTRHAGCPVLAGSKWVCNKWIRMFGQEFIRPCPINR